jgi:Toprim-like
MNVEDQILDALQNDQALKFKSIKGRFYSGGICPKCGETELFISTEKPYQLKCSRNNNCGYSESTRERYSYLWENLGEKHPATDSEPNATAKAYMSMVRGFPLQKIGNWFEQGTLRLSNGRAAETVRFMLWDGFWWDRLINTKDIRDNLKNGKPNKADFKFGISYRDKCWQPPGQKIEAGDKVYVVEGIFHAIAFSLAGYKVVAAFSSNNLPRELIKENANKKINWCLAYDAGQAGEDASIKFYNELTKQNETVSIALPHSAESDWDDLYREDKLNDDYLSDCAWRGRLLSATSIKKKAFALYCWKHFTFTVLTFSRETYSVRVVTEKLSRELDGQTIDFNDNEHHDIFVNSISIAHIANCDLKFLHIEKDKFTEERKYLFDVLMPNHQKPFLVGFSPSNLGDSKAISTALLNQTNFGYFKGCARDLDWLTQRWASQRIYTVETVPFIGYEENTQSYVFPNVGYQDGQCVKVNNHGYIHFRNCSIKTTLNIEFIHTTKFDPSFLPDFIKVFDMNGLATLSFYTMSLFAQQIKKSHQNLTFLEVTGEKEAGKSTLIRFLWKLFGRVNYEGVDINSLSVSAEARTLSQVSNMPIVFLESDKEMVGNAKGGRNQSGIDWERYKKISDLNGTIGSRGVKTNDNQTNDLIFRGALVISQNATVSASPAILSRIVHLHCTTAHKRIENRPIADRLKSMATEDLAGFLHHALTHEKAYLNAFFAAYTVHRDRLTKNPEIKSQRVVDNHAQVMAGVSALKVLFKNFREDDLANALKHLEARAIDRDIRLKAEHPLVQQFWETYHWINDQVMEVVDEDGQRQVKTERLNHSSDPKLIAIHLNDFFEQSRKRNQELISIGDLKQVLPQSQHYRFLRQGRVQSRLQKTQVRCWVFQKPASSSTD